MGNLRKLKRNLKIDKSQLAEQTRVEQIKLVKQMCVERVGNDPVFAKEILDAVGDVLPPEVKKAAEESIAKDREAKQQALKDDVAYMPCKKENWSSLPLDPLIEGNAPETDYPENQGMGAAIGRAMKQKDLMI